MAGNIEEMDSSSEESTENSEEDIDSNSEEFEGNSEEDVNSNSEQFAVDLSAIIRTLVNDKELDQKSENELEKQKKLKKTSKKSIVNKTKPSKKKRVVIAYSDSDDTCDDLSSPETFDESEIYTKPNKLPELMTDKMMSVYIKPSSSNAIIIPTGAEEDLIEFDTKMEEKNPNTVSIESSNVDKDNSKVIINAFSANIESDNELIEIYRTIKQKTLPISTPFQAHNIGEIDSKIIGNNLPINQENGIEVIALKSSLEEEITVLPRNAVEVNPGLLAIDLSINSMSIPLHNGKSDEPELMRSNLMNDSNAISFNETITIPINPNIDTDCQSDLTVLANLTVVSSVNPNEINEKSQDFNIDLGDPMVWNMNPAIPPVDLNETNDNSEDRNIDLGNQTIPNLCENTAELGVTSKDEINLNESIEQPVDAVFVKKGNKRIKITETDIDCGKKLKTKNIGKKSKSDILPTTSEAVKLHNDTNDNLNLSVNNLFGDISDISSDEDNSIVRSNKQLQQNQTLVSLNKPIELDESADIKIKIPRIYVDLGKDSFKVKLPNILSIDSEPFDTTLYDDEIEITGKTDEEGRERIKLKVNNTIRWRYALNEKKEKMKETNARMVHWSDNSYTLHLGNEIYIATKMQLLDDDYEYIFARQQRNFEALAKITQKFTFRPHSTESSTHRKMTMSLAERSFNREVGTKFLSNTGKDPTLEQKLKIKEAERDLRAYERNRCRVPNVKLKRKKNTNKENSNVEDGENVISIDAIKNRYKRKKPEISAVSNLINSKSKQLKPFVSNDDKSSGEESVQFNVSRTKKLNRQKVVFNLDSDDDTNI
ncbi:uncharacterized protein LOC119680966 [Teleopsis dalmanni]|uniref:uncharacterized protein LOC119680966 n=1 Tax=Teleopsis dalmanni TaxID=139649 RepID=UPI0018CFA022|nr:uncharacterized protein LOC119680966 [Teleopsis dalmanni]XP_037949942.1 uncharacterized protein LOC119680966 [Teleopsis dalmanni]XP_037949943.1 uncharacterized protein LOC119680966 [Teleopsis dalmanni]